MAAPATGFYKGTPTDPWSYAVHPNGTIWVQKGDEPPRMVKAGSTAHSAILSGMESGELHPAHETPDHDAASAEHEAELAPKPKVQAKPKTPGHEHSADLDGEYVGYPEGATVNGNGTPDPAAHSSKPKPPVTRESYAEKVDMMADAAAKPREYVGDPEGEATAVPAGTHGVAGAAIRASAHGAGRYGPTTAPLSAGVRAGGAAVKGLLAGSETAFSAGKAAGAALEPYLSRAISTLEPHMSDADRSLLEALKARLKGE